MAATALTISRRTFDHGLTAAVIAAVLVLAALVAGSRLGIDANIDRSDSMAPALRAGDVVLSRRVAPSSVRAGDVVTFSDPARGGDRVTHRVVSVKSAPAGSHVFVTKGDANDATERWTASAGETVGLMQTHVPKVGYAVAFSRDPAVRGAVCGLIVLALGSLLLRRIWSA